MGGKIGARRAMEAAGVPIVPGDGTHLLNLEQAEATANKLAIQLC